MKKAIIVFGTSGAGKTKFLDYFLEGKNSCICPDDFSIISFVPSQNFETTFWDLLKKKIIESFQKKDKVIIELAATQGRRQKLIKILRKEGVKEIIGFYIRISLDEAKERNSKRREPRPKQAIEEVNNDLRDHPPTLEEGFDFIYKINSDGIQDRIST